MIVKLIENEYNKLDKKKFSRMWIYMFKERRENRTLEIKSYKIWRNRGLNIGNFFWNILPPKPQTMYYRGENGFLKAVSW